MKDFPGELVINWDQTGIHYVPISSWTMAKKGSKRVEIPGSDDKRQITGVFGGTMAGDFLPPQLIYQGKTRKSLPPVTLTPDLHVIFTENHWSNEKAMVDYWRRFFSDILRRKSKSSS